MESKNFDDLFHLYYPEIMASCYAMVKNREDAEELTLEAFVIGYEKYNPVKKASFRTFIHKIAHNLCIDFLRSRKFRNRQQEQSLDEFVGKNIREFSKDDIDVREILEALYHCLAQLNGEEEGAVYKYFIQGFTYDEIAEIMILSSGTVRNRIHSGIKKLEVCLQKNDVLL